MKEIERIAKLLKSDAIEKQIAAAIVLAELGAKAPAVIDGLTNLLDSPVPAVQRHALDALARVGAKKAAPRVFSLLLSNAADVREAAARALASVGDAIVPTIRARMVGASPDEKRALDGVLADLGGKEAFSALLASLGSSEEESAKAAAYAVRQRVKDADPRERRGYLAETERFLAKCKGPKAHCSSATVAAAIKILGYLEDEKAVPTLLAYANEPKQDASVRQEAVIALRFALGERTAGAKVVEALVRAAESDDRALAQTALHTLATLKTPVELAPRLSKLVGHADLERARFVMEHLGRQRGIETARVLVDAIVGLERRRAEIAASALGAREEAAAPLAKALLETEDADRGWLLRNALRPVARSIPAATRKQLLDVALRRLAAGGRGWEALLEVVRDADPARVAASLRELVPKLRKHEDRAATALRLLCRSEEATDDDRYGLAAAELRRSACDPSGVARDSDEALRLLQTLIDRGYDVGSALRKDKSLDLDRLYYVGFHFSEKRQGIGEELLREVAKKGGRTKIAKMAKNKLGLAEQAV